MRGRTARAEVEQGLPRWRTFVGAKLKDACGKKEEAARNKMK